ncbi:cytochrome c oxidase assembly factor CtaG [Metabacillus iocasae]|uniref:Membrane protein n=1 Tax=Priestia iocasae TaxID=2291674 RepID=A0ABS2QV38_9BACI|nr:cytochrome c oxidase assembly factor CtaG [Metabacillus iocasae]MBM7703350.1 putative membrane protein [Metabacillus iocasae]
MISNLQVFGFQALWSPYFFLVIAAITVFYFVIIHRLRTRFAESEPVHTKTKAYFVISMVLLYLFKGGPVDLLGHLMFSAHMTQMAIVYLAIPPLLILGIPNWLARAVINNKVIKPFFSFFSKPLIALLVFNGTFSFYHIPLIFDVVKTDATLHAIVSFILFFTAFFMWWPLMNQLPEQQTLSGVKKIGYIFADGILLTPACALIIFADTSLYATYTDPQAWVNALALCVPPSMLAALGTIGPEMFNMLPPVEDQQLGGVIMKVIQEIVYGTILGYIFFQWAKKERQNDELELSETITPTSPLR